MPNIDYLKELDSLSEEEREYALSILKEISERGSSSKYEELLFSDYKEIPVTIEEFLHNKNYLGNGLTSEDGRFTVFPYWEDMLKKLFPTNIDTAYNTLVLSGAIGLGKSFVAVIAMLYLLYRMMCLKNPYQHYGLQPIDHITFSLMNITMDAAKGVAWSKIQELLQSSPWFMAHGHCSKSQSPEWQPDENIELIYGSQPRHVIGRAVFCLDGETVIRTSDGDEKIKNLVDKDIKVLSIDDYGDIITSDTCTVKPTVTTDEEYNIELEDGTVIKCTPNHKLMLKDGTYKEAQYLTEDDELMDVGMSYNEYIQSIIDKRGQWNIPKGAYWEGHHILPRCVGGGGTAKAKHDNIIRLYPEEHFIAHKLLAIENPDNAKLVLAWSMMAFPKGKTNRDFEIKPQEYKILREMQSKLLSVRNPCLKNGAPWNKGKSGVYSEDTLSKMRAPRLNSRGRKLSESTKKKMSEATKNRYINNPESFKSPIKGKRFVNNGTNCISIGYDDSIPEGYCLGQGKHKKYTIKNAKSFGEIRSKLSSGKNNPMYGKGYKVSDGKNGHAVYIYEYRGVEFDCRKNLLIELKKVFPDVSNSAIRRIMSGKYTNRISYKYKDIIDNLSWRLKKDEN